MIHNEIPSAMQNKRMERLSSVYCGILFVLHPLMMHNGYFDITETKQIVFVGLTVAWLVCTAALMYPSNGCIGSICPEDMYSFLLVALYMLATFLCGHLSKGWIGADNRYQGIASFALYYIIFVFLSRRRISEKVLIPVGVGFALVMLLATINHLGGDPLRLMENLVPFDRGRYISTIGNINFFGAYVCLILPIFWIRYCCGTNPHRQKWRFFLIVLGTVGAAASNSDCTVLGLAAAWLLLPFMARKSEVAVKRWILLLPFTIAVLHFFRIITACLNGGNFSPVLQLILNPVVSICLLFAAFVVLVWERKNNYTSIEDFCRGYALVLIIGVIVFLIVLVLMNTVFLQTDLGVLSEYMVFDSDWGTDRGRVWNACIERWVDMPWWQKILGGGSGCVAQMDSLNPVFSDAILDAAHCEYLHYLLTHGILGLGLYLGLNGMILYRCTKSGSGLSAALGLGVVGYLAQSTVNIAQPMTTPLYFVLLAMLAGRLRRIDPEKI